MLRSSSSLHSNVLRFNCARAIISKLLHFPPIIHFSIKASAENPPTSSFLEASQAHRDLPSLNFSGFAKSVISKCSYRGDNNRGEKFTIHSLKYQFQRLSNISPGIVRRYWRISVLKPRDVLEILLQFESEKIEIKAVEYLWGIFIWASEQYKGFEHCPQACKVMASMLARVGFLGQAELLLSRREILGICLDCVEVFDNLIEGYVGEFELDRALLIYVRMRKLLMSPSISSYRSLLKYLIELNETKLVYLIYTDMIVKGIRESVEDVRIYESVIRLLCVDGKVQQARDLVKKVMDEGIRPSDLVINAISCGYCGKKDYDDLLNFFAEFGIEPDIIVGNKILHSLCQTFGVDRAKIYFEKLEKLGFCADEKTQGILIGFSCRDGRLKDAFFYISDILARGMKPHVYSYNTLLSVMFKEGMWMLSEDIRAEMNEMEVTPDFSTFRVLLAGFCKARKFDEVKALVREMADHSLLTLSPLEDPLTKGFMLLGFNPLAVRIRRDNDKGFSKTEFYDNLGNGLYMDTDLDEYERKITLVLDDAMMLDINSSLIQKCCSLDAKSSLLVIDEMAKWGQEISPPAMSSLLGCLSRDPFNIETINHQLAVMSTSTYQLDQKTLNMLVQMYSKNGLDFKSRAIFDGMLRRGFEIETDTYSALLLNTCNKCDLRSFHYISKLLQKSSWSPKPNDVKSLLRYLCKNEWINEALELFETVLSVISSSDISDILRTLLRELCRHGYSSTASVMLYEFSSRGNIVDSMTYSHLMSGFCQEKRLAEALELFETMHSKNLSPFVDLYPQLIYQLCKTNNVKKAFELKNICLRDQPSALRLIDCAIIKGFCKLGRVREASNLFKATLVNGLVPDAYLFNSLIELYCGENNLKKVRELLGVMIRRNLSIFVSSYSNLVQLICTEGRFSLAARFKELIHQVTYLSELVLSNILIFHFSSLRNSFLLDVVIGTIQKKGLQFDDATYNFIVRGYLLCNDESRSLHYLMTMIEQDLRPSRQSLRNIIHCLCRNGDVISALKLSREMEARGWIHDSSIQSDIVEALLSNCKLQEAVEFLDRIALKNLIPNNIEYDYLIKQFCQYGGLDKAVDLLNIMLQKGGSPASASYDYLIQGFCDVYKLDTALDLYAEMLYKGLKPIMRTNDILVYRLCEYSMEGEAEEVLKSIIQAGETPSPEAFRAVIDKYRSVMNVSKTIELVKLMQQMGYEPDFDTHWSLVSNLNNSSKKDESNQSSSFLSSLLSGFGFARKSAGTKVG